MKFSDYAQRLLYAIDHHALGTVLHEAITEIDSLKNELQRKQELLADIEFYYSMYGSLQEPHLGKIKKELEAQ